MTDFSHDFQSDFNKTDDPILDQKLEEHYKILIKDYLDITRTRPLGFKRGCQFQIHGMDKIIITTIGELFGVEEKVRFQLVCDFLIEFLSNTANGKYGWISAPYWCKWFVYYIEPINKIYIFLWQELRQAFQDNGEIWKATYGIKISNNGSYESHNVPVPEDVLLACCPSTLTNPQTTAVELVKAFYAERKVKELQDRMEFLMKYDPKLYEFLKNNPDKL